MADVAPQRPFPLGPPNGEVVVASLGILFFVPIGSWWAMVGLSIATFGFYGSKGPFWSIPPMFITGTAAAASIAWINSLGNLGGFFGPWYVGVIKDWTGSYAGGLYGLAFLCVVSAVVCALFLDIPIPPEHGWWRRRRPIDVPCAFRSEAASRAVTGRAVGNPSEP